MNGTIVDTINGGSVWLLIVNLGDRMVQQPVEPRYMADIVSSEGLSEPAELAGRQIKLSEDGMTICLE